MANRLFVQQLLINIKMDIIAPHYWPLERESSGDQWFPLTILWNAFSCQIIFMSTRDLATWDVTNLSVCVRHHRRFFFRYASSPEIPQLGYGELGSCHLQDESLAVGPSAYANAREISHGWYNGTRNCPYGKYGRYLDGLVQEIRNSITKALELRLSCTNPSICVNIIKQISSSRVALNKRPNWVFFSEWTIQMHNSMYFTDNRVLWI